MLIVPPFNAAPGVYPIVLQSFDNNGSVKSTLKEDTVIVEVMNKACLFTEEAAQAMQDTLNDNPLEFEATALIASYEMKSYKLALQSLNVAEACGEMHIELESPHAYLRLDQTTQSVIFVTSQST